MFAKEGATFDYGYRPYPVYEADFCAEGAARRGQLPYLKVFYLSYKTYRRRGTVKMRGITRMQCGRLGHMFGKARGAKHPVLYQYMLFGYIKGRNGTIGGTFFQCTYQYKGRFLGINRSISEAFTRLIRIYTTVK